ncbi:hypothetical protein L4D74_24940, partial [Vibrio cionasavignyae]
LKPRWSGREYQLYRHSNFKGCGIGVRRERVGATCPQTRPQEQRNITNCSSRQLTVGDFGLVEFSDYGGFVWVWWQLAAT